MKAGLNEVRLNEVRLKCGCCVMNLRCLSNKPIVLKCSDPVDFYWLLQECNYDNVDIRPIMFGGDLSFNAENVLMLFNPSFGYYVLETYRSYTLHSAKLDNNRFVGWDKVWFEKSAIITKETAMSKKVKKLWKKSVINDNSEVDEIDKLVKEAENMVKEINEKGEGLCFNGTFEDTMLVLSGDDDVSGSDRGGVLGNSSGRSTYSGCGVNADSGVSGYSGDGIKFDVEQVSRNFAEVGEMFRMKGEE